jgi:hypothetical protein
LLLSIGVITNIDVLLGAPSVRNLGMLVVAGR